MASAVRRLSPVSMMTSIPIAFSERTASIECSFNVSATAITPATRPSTARIIAVLPASSIAWRTDSAASTGIPALTMSDRFPIRIRCSPMAARTPWPGIASKSLGSSSLTPFATAAWTIASPSGCSEPFSADAASRRISASEIAPTGTTSVTDGRSFVSVLDEFDDLVQGRVRADARGTEAQQPGPIDRGADRGVSDLLFHRDRLSRDHRLVNGGEPPDNHPVDGDALPWPDDDQVVHLDELHGNLLLVVVPDHPRRPRGKVHELSDCVARLSLRNFFEVFAKQDETNDDGRSVVVRAFVRERNAEEREKRYDGAVSKRSTRANGDEDIHVRALVPDGVEEAAVEAISCDELHRRGEDEEHKVHRFLETHEPPAQSLPEANHKKRNPNPEAEQRESLQPRQLLLRCGERLEAGLRAEVVLSAADDGGEVRTFIHIHAAHRVGCHRRLLRRGTVTVGHPASALHL